MYTKDLRRPGLKLEPRYKLGVNARAETKHDARMHPKATSAYRIVITKRRRIGQALKNAANGWLDASWTQAGRKLDAGWTERVCETRRASKLHESSYCRHR